MNRKKNDRSKGFTIVELVVVIAVVGILTAITIVGYNNAQKTALNAHKAAQLSSWRDLFELYYAKNGEYPPRPATQPGGAAREFCLGRDFNYDACWNVYAVMGPSGVKGAGPQPNEPIAYGDETLMQQLETVGALPGKSRCIVDWDCPAIENGVGPMVEWTSADKPSYVYDFFFGGKCPGDILQTWTDGNASVCRFKLLDPSLTQ